ncbi:MAG TPA: STAS domain-containing protein [Candidatus Baltobacteraceae bacterium]|nr:STAS domain-containing protein [Candidatus Baltobacteraceae bacterium]
MKSITVLYRPDALDELQATLLAAFDSGVERVVLDLDGIAQLDAGGVRGLIALLRRSRDVGGVVAVHTSRSDIARSLDEMALDRLFPVVSAA